MLLACSLPMLTACSVDDDDEVIDRTSTLDFTQPASGSITVTDSKGSYVCKVRDAGYRLWTTDLDVRPTLTFLATFWNISSTSYRNHQIEELYFYKSEVDGIHVGRIVPGGMIRVIDIISLASGQLTTYMVSSLSGYFDGDVSITGFDPNKTVTVKFTDCSFGASSSSYSHRGIATGTFSGEITFALRDRDFFE